MKSLLLASSITLLACQPGVEDMRIQEDTQEAAAKPEQRVEQSKTRLTTSKDGTRIAFEKSGSGPALIIVSGALSQRSLFRDQPLVPSLSKQFTVYIYDRRGRGESTDVQPYSVEREIEDLDALLHEAGGSAHLYAVSSGAALALQAAAKLGPAKVRALAIYDAPYGQDEQTYTRQKQGVVDRVRTGSPGEAATFFLSSIGTPPQALEEMKRSPVWETMSKIDFTLAYDYAVLGNGAVPEATVRTIRVPTLVMNGGDSLKFMHPAADRIAALIPQGQRKTLEGQSHQVDAEVIVPVLVEFFTGSSDKR